MSSFGLGSLTLSYATDVGTIPHEDDRRILHFISIVNAKALSVLQECVAAEPSTRQSSGFVPSWLGRLRQECIEIAQQTASLMEACYGELSTDEETIVARGRMWYRDEAQASFNRLAEIQTELFTNQHPEEEPEPPPVAEEPPRPRHNWCIIL